LNALLEVNIDIHVGAYHVYIALLPRRIDGLITQTDLLSALLRMIPVEQK
jgi:CBS-domain-containing membrane protein